MIPTDISIELDNGNKCIMIEADTIIPTSNTKKFIVNKLDLNFNIYQKFFYLSQFLFIFS